MNLAAFFVLLQTSNMQTYLGKIITQQLSEKTGFKITVTKVAIDWLDKVNLEGISVIDMDANPLISAEGIMINYRVSSLFNAKTIVIDEAELINPQINLALSNNSPLNLTSFINQIKHITRNGSAKPTKNFFISELSIKNGHFTYNNIDKENLQERFDYNHFGFEHFDLVGSNLMVTPERFELKINAFKGKELSSGLDVSSLKTNYLVKHNQMKFKNLELQVGASTVSDSMVFTYKNWKDLNHFNEKVSIQAHFNYINLATQEAKYFAPYFKTIHDTLHFKGNIDGKISNFTIKNAEIRFGKASSVFGSAYFEGLPDIYNTFLDVNLKNTTIHKTDLEKYITQASFKKYFPFDSAKVRGSFTGYPKDFVTKATFITQLGYAETDINLKLNKNTAKSTYSGTLNLIDFELAKLNKDLKPLEKISLTGSIKGTGLTLKSANFTLISHISKAKIYKYNYQNIETNASFANELFEGNFTVNDPNIKLSSKGIIDFRTSKKIIKLSGSLKEANLHELKIRKDTATLAANFTINLQGNHLDSILGNVTISDLQATNNQLNYTLNKLELISELKNNTRSLVVYSNRVNAQLIGSFTYTEAAKDISYLWQELRTKVRNNSQELKNFYKNNTWNAHKSTIEIHIELEDINPLLNLFDPLIHLSKNTIIHGNLQTDSTLNLDLSFKNDTITYDHNYLINNDLNILTKSSASPKNTLLNLKFNSNRQKLRSNSQLDSLLLTTNWENNTVKFNVKLQQPESRNNNDINGRITFLNDTTLLQIDYAKIELLDKKWHINKDNKITFTKDKLELHEISLESEEQFIEAFGTISANTSEPIHITAKNVQMNNLNPLLPNKIEGNLSGSASLSDIFSTPRIETNFKIQSFRVDTLLFGNITGKSKWSQPNQWFDLNLFIARDTTRLLNITGTYKPLGDSDALHLNAELLQTDLALFEPFTKKLFSKFKGTATGNIQITGPLFEPVLQGNGKINKAGLTIDYLNAPLNVSGLWRFDSSSISLHNLKITDNQNGDAVLNVVFKHSHFKNFTMDLNATYSNLTLLNTTTKDNNYYYGTAVGSGNLSINGPLKNLVVTAHAKTEKGTRFYIPLSTEGSEIKQNEFIKFNNFTHPDATKVKKLENKVKFNNITVNLDLEVTPDAYAEIIFDLTAGDIIRGRGTGNISVGVDNKGQFTVLGEYEFNEGAYNFTMYNIVNKEFTINPKSKISWSGDPYLAKMQIDAIYKVNTSLAPIIDTLYQSLPEVKRIYPSKVLLDLNGQMLTPTISFDIKIDDYPKSNVNIDTEVQAFLNKIHNDEQELNRQVFSLLVFRKYSPPNSFSTGGTVGSSVSEFVSNQLSYWISQVDENLTIDFDLGNLDQDALETFQLRVSYAFMDGKLIVTRDGGFTDQNKQATLASITGDWTVEYLISDDGKLRIKLFKKTNYDQVSSSSGSNDELVSGGFSLLYTTSFDRLIDIFKGSKTKNSPKNKDDIPNSKGIKPKEEENTP